MIKKWKVIFLIFVLMAFIAACGGTDGEQKVSDSDLILTKAVEIANEALAATQAEEATLASMVTDTPEPTATFTPEPTSTNTLQPTATLEQEVGGSGTQSAATATPVTASQPGKGCFAASYGSETIADGTRYPYDKEFTKTWRVKNIGSCNWDPGKVELVWVATEIDGKEGIELLGAGSVIPLGNVETVYPNGYLTIEVKFTMPDKSARYKVYYALRSEGTIFYVDGGNLWLDVIAFDPVTND